MIRLSTKMPSLTRHGAGRPPGATQVDLLGIHAERVAEEDARRRSNGRKWPVAKNDLSVMLKILIHRRIAPWSNHRAYPRIRAVASELLTLRNLHAHGEECLGEYARLVDTSRRLLELLGLPIPAQLTPVDRETPASKVGVESMVLASRTQVSLSRLDKEIASLGELGEQIIGVITRAGELSAQARQAFDDACADLNMQDPDWNAFTLHFNDACEPIGAAVLELLATAERAQADWFETSDPHLEALAQFSRCELSNPFLLAPAMLNLSSLNIEVVELYLADAERLAELIESGQLEDARVVSQSAAGRELTRRLEEGQRLIASVNNDDAWRELLRRASQLSDASPMSNAFVVSANLALLHAEKDDDGNWTAEAIPYVRDAVARLRFEAGMEPGTSFESLLVQALKFEGEIYSDLGRTEEAIQSFARANEIVDRYPTSDPAVGG